MKYSRIVCVCLLVLFTVSCFAQVKLHVKPAALQFNNVAVDVPIVAGTGFVVGVPYSGGVGPYTCTGDSNTPSFVSYTTQQPAAQSTTGNCVATANSTPVTVPTTDTVFNMIVTDSKGATSSVTITITPN